MTVSRSWPLRPPSIATFVVAGLIYGGWIAATLAAGRLPPLLLAAIGGWLIAWQGSLQHETIHGHPTRVRWVNRLLGFAPLSLWIPYGRYERLHLAHHATEHLTVPNLDTESRYLASGSGALSRLCATATATLAGRLTLGPVLEIGGFLAGEFRALLANEPGVRRAWANHLLGVAAVLGWLVFVCQMNLGLYLLCFVYPGCALSLLRSFAEHRAHHVATARIAVVERAPLFGLLFLNNNLHAAHHAFPGVPWFSLPSHYRRHRETLLEANSGLVYDGYQDIFRRYLLRSHDQAVHPQGDAARRLETIS